MKKYALVSLAIIICMMFTACGAASHSVMTESADDNGFFYYSSKEEVKSEALYDGALNYGQNITAGGTSSVISEEKLVYTSRVSLETENFDEASKTLHDTISALGGIIVNENASNLNTISYSGYRRLDITVRIPQENYNTFLSGLSENYNVASVNNSVENMTEYYYDSNNRLKSYRIQEERLFAMLEKAESVKEMLEIESRLCDVQYQIESITNTLRTIDNDVKYATFYIYLNEVTKFTTPAPKTFGDRLTETLKDSAETFTEFAEGLLFGLIYFIPYLVIISVVAVIVIASVKRANKKRRAKAEIKEEK